MDSRRLVSAHTHSRWARASKRVLSRERRCAVRCVVDQLVVSRHLSSDGRLGLFRLRLSLRSPAVDGSTECAVQQQGGVARLHQPHSVTAAARRTDTTAQCADDERSGGCLQALWEQTARALCEAFHVLTPLTSTASLLGAPRNSKLERRNHNPRSVGSARLVSEADSNNQSRQCSDRAAATVHG